MAMDKKIYEEFKAIVGEKNISQDPIILETYRCRACQNSAHYGPYDHKTPVPLAVLMPGSTDEVQQIVILCNKYKISFKGSTTFWSSQGYIGTDNAVQLDMRRMRSVTIDEKNMTAIIEPYATAVMIQSEAMKHGLTPNVGGMGCSSSILASTAGWQGPGPSSIYTGTAYDNLICAEWVLPNGELIKTGSAGGGEGWFHGDGIGPSLRALLRGGVGTAGDMGICTKMSIKLAPWYGPKVIPVRGNAPAYKASLDYNMKAYTVCFPDWDSWARATQYFHETRILYAGHRQFNMFGRDIKCSMVKILSDSEKQLCDLNQLLEDPETKAQNENMKIDIQIILSGSSKLDMEYKEKALDEILRRVGGWKSKMMEDKELHDWLLMFMLRMGHKNLNYVLCGAYEGHFGLHRTNYYMSAAVVEEAAQIKKEHEQSGTYMAAVGGNSCMGGMAGIGGGGAVSWEFFAHFDAHEKESVEGVCEYFKVSNKWMAEKGLGGCMGKLNESSRTPQGYNLTQEQHNAMFSKTAQPEIFEYQFKIKELLNPNNLTGTYYKTVDPKVVDKSLAGSVGVFV